MNRRRLNARTSSLVRANHSPLVRFDRESLVPVRLDAARIVGRDHVDDLRLLGKFDSDLLVPLRNAVRLADLVVLAEPQHVHGAVHALGAHLGIACGAVVFGFGQDAQHVPVLGMLGGVHSHRLDHHGAFAEVLVVRGHAGERGMGMPFEHHVGLRGEPPELRRELGQREDERVPLMCILRAVRREAGGLNGLAPATPVFPAPPGLGDARHLPEAAPAEGNAAVLGGRASDLLDDVLLRHPSGRGYTGSRTQRDAGAHDRGAFPANLATLGSLCEPRSMRYVADPRCPRHYEYDVLPVSRETRHPEAVVWECSVSGGSPGRASPEPRAASAASGKPRPSLAPRRAGLPRRAETTVKDSRQRAASAARPSGKRPLRASSPP